MKFTNHHVSDLVVRLKNAAQRNHLTTILPNVKIVVSILKLLEEQGYIQKFVVDTFQVTVHLKYLKNESIIKKINVVSKPSIRVYKGAKDIPSFYNGLGVTVVSTPKGILTDNQARDFGVGGEVLCQVF
ncbi:MAG: small subunit ribosomal protein S8 [Alphaproteobacteria bacterium]|jgi:small subunit ribosomal protein S8